MMTGSSGSVARRASSRSSPLPSGRRRSRRTTSGGVVETRRLASAVVAAWATWKLCRVKYFARLRARTASSSTMSTVAMRRGFLRGSRQGRQGAAGSPCSKTASVLRHMQQASVHRAVRGPAPEASHVWYGHCSRTSATIALKEATMRTFQRNAYSRPLVAGVALLALGFVAVPARASHRVQQTLAATDTDQDARGRAQLVLRTDADGKFD